LKIFDTQNRKSPCEEQNGDAAVVSLVITATKFLHTKKEKISKKYWTNISRLIHQDGLPQKKKKKSPGWFRSHTRFFLFFLDLIMLAKTCELFVLKITGFGLSPGG
jgi:hypothetical protein